MKKHEYRLAGLLKDCKSWNDLHLKIKKLSKEEESGKVFEAFCKYYFLLEPTVKDDYLNVWYFDEIPPDIRKQVGFGNRDEGVDLLLQDTDNEFFAVQCKFRSNQEVKLNWSGDDLTNPIAYISGLDKISGCIIFTNASDLDGTSKSRIVSLFNISHLNKIEEYVFEKFLAKINNRPCKTVEKHSPREHQQIAIENCIRGFENADRGQLILPCGAGKSLTALWIKEALKAKNTLILVPSLALLRQIKDDWKIQRRLYFTYLCVCSEQSIDKDKDSEDSIIMHTYELDYKVTTDAAKIQTFLAKDSEKVIFSTYQSLEQISAAIKDTDFQFDLVICDEAHKTAGINDGLFSLIHKNENIPARKRLYMTATPRIVSENVKKQLEEDFKFSYDMSNPDIYGEEFYRMSFKDAIEAGILVDYKIIAIGVTNEEIKKYCDERRWVSDKNSIDEIVNNYALDKVMYSYNATHAITFHHTVKKAEAFSDTHKRFSEDVKIFHVKGTQSTSERSIQMEGFKKSKKAVISNARCLTEGVDVPAIDLVYFCDPKNSKIDIIQAIGRALRQDKARGKELGYIVVPILHENNDDVEKAIDSSIFKNLISVVRALCDQDERLEVEINQLSLGRGKQNQSSNGRIEFFSGIESERLYLVGFEELLKNAIFSAIIEKTTTAWDRALFEFKQYLEKNNGEYPKEGDLYDWVKRQRSNRKQLSDEKLRKLEGCNFIWEEERDLKWDKNFEATRDYINKTGEKPRDKVLALWYRTQTAPANDAKLSTSQKESMKELSDLLERKGNKKNEKLMQELKAFVEKFFEYPEKDRKPDLHKFHNDIKNNSQYESDIEEIKAVIKNGKWNEDFEKLKEYRDKNPNNTWSEVKQKSEVEEIKTLWTTYEKMRTKYVKDELDENQLKKLELIGFVFDKLADAWHQNYLALKQYLEQNDKLPPSTDSLYGWIQNNRDKENLTDEQRLLLEDLNINSYFKEKMSWDECYDKVKDFWESNGKLPTKTTDSGLQSWLQKQRDENRKGRLEEEKVNKLELLGISWDKDEQWSKNFEALKEFQKYYKYTPRFNVTGEEKRLYNWCQSLRLNGENNLEDWKLELLREIDFDFNPNETKANEWHKKFEDYANHIKNGKDIPQNIDGVRNPLYSWLHNQKAAFKKRKLTEERIQEFKNIGVFF